MARFDYTNESSIHPYYVTKHIPVERHALHNKCSDTDHLLLTLFIIYILYCYCYYDANYCCAFCFIIIIIIIVIVIVINVAIVVLFCRFRWCFFFLEAVTILTGRINDVLGMINLKRIWTRGNITLIVAYSNIILTTTYWFWQKVSFLHFSLIMLICVRNKILDEKDFGLGFWRQSAYRKFLIIL